MLPVSGNEKRRPEGARVTGEDRASLEQLTATLQALLEEYEGTDAAVHLADAAASLVKARKQLGG